MSDKITTDIEEIIAPFRISKDELGLEPYVCRRELILRISIYIHKREEKILSEIIKHLKGAKNGEIQTD